MGLGTLIAHGVSALILTGSLWAQPFLYHETQDKKAQSVESAAKQITNGAVFDKEIQNLDALSKLQIQRVLSFAQVQFKSGIDGFNKWKDVSEQLDAVAQSLETASTLTPKEATDQIAAVNNKINEVKASIAKLQDQADDSGVIQEIQNNLATADEVLNSTKNLPVDEQFSQTIEHIKNALDTAKSLYDSFAGVFAARSTTEGKLPTLDAAQKTTELHLLNLEVQHLQWTAQNSSREKAESAVVLALVDSARNKLARANLSNSEEPIETTLERLAQTAAGKGEKAAEKEEPARTEARNKLSILLVALHEAAAARSQAGLPKQLADLRDTREVYRYSILRSAEQVKATEALIQGAATQLALYYKGGIKPAQLAQLLYNLSGLVSLPVIASK